MFRNAVFSMLLVVMFISGSYGQDVKVDPLFQGTFVSLSAMVQASDFARVEIVDMKVEVFWIATIQEMSFPAMMKGTYRVVKIERDDFKFWPAGGKTIKAYKFYMEGMPQPAHIGYFGKDNDGDDIFLFRDRNQEGHLVHIKLYKTTD